MSPKEPLLTEQDVLGIIMEEAPELRVESQRLKGGLEVLTQLLLFGSSIKAFAGLWNVVELLIRRRANYTVRLRATGDDGSSLEMEVSELTRREAEERWRSFQINTGRPVQLTLWRSDR